MHCSNSSFHSLWSGFVSISPVKLNVTALPGSESRERKGGVQRRCVKGEMMEEQGVCVCVCMCRKGCVSLWLRRFICC